MIDEGYWCEFVIRSTETMPMHHFSNGTNLCLGRTKHHIIVSKAGRTVHSEKRYCILRFGLETSKKCRISSVGRAHDS
jgi:hypothetical protein